MNASESASPAEAEAYGQLNLNELFPGGSRTIDCFENLEKIGQGTYGQVYTAKEIKTGEIVALKKIRMDNVKQGVPSFAVVMLVSQITVSVPYNKLEHENVIHLKEVVTSPGREQDEHVNSGEYMSRIQFLAIIDVNKYKGSTYMVFEYMDHDLAGLADRLGYRFSIPEIKCYMKQLLTGLHYCHDNKVLHRDIKGANLLIDNEGNLKLADFGLARPLADDEGNLKLADFGLAQLFADDEGNLTNNVVSLWYRPPELLFGVTKYGPSVDMWSVGCIFAELLLGRVLLPGTNEPDQVKKIFNLCGFPDESNWPGVSKIAGYNMYKPTEAIEGRFEKVFRYYDKHALKLLEKMLTLDPSKRIAAKAALESEYFSPDPLPCDPKRQEICFF